jgi:hypothetical protein
VPVQAGRGRCGSHRYAARIHPTRLIGWLTDAACADNWPPLRTAGDPAVQGRTDELLIGVNERGDGY